MRSRLQAWPAAAFLLGSVSAIPLTPRSSNGPVISSNFQDPSLIKVGSTFYAFSGPNGNPAVNIQVATSPDFSSWSVHSGYDALPSVGAWAAGTPHLWAPDVNELPDGSFVMYYSAAVASSPAQHCVGVATSTSILGPYTPLPEPLTCDLSTGGSIDPDGFLDPQSSNNYVLYKVDGGSIGSGGACSNSNQPNTPTPILLQQVGSNGYTKIGPAYQILTNDPSDGSGIEAPSLFYDPGTTQYILIYNSGCFVDPSYSIKFATSPTLTGPYFKAGTLLTTGATAGDVQLPGGLDVVRGTDQDTFQIRAVFHGDLNSGWFLNDGSKRVRGMYAVELAVQSYGSYGAGLSAQYLY